MPAPQACLRATPADRPEIAPSCPPSLLMIVRPDRLPHSVQRPVPNTTLSLRSFSVQVQVFKRRRCGCRQPIAAFAALRAVLADVTLPVKSGGKDRATGKRDNRGNDEARCEPVRLFARAAHGAS